MVKDPLERVAKELKRISTLGVLADSYMHFPTGESPNKSDVTISVSQADFVKLFSGKLSPTSA